MSESFDSWMQAEIEIAVKLSELTRMEFGKTFVIGDVEDIAGRINLAAFVIAGGMDQAQAHQAGADCWHTEGRYVGIFHRRQDALKMGSTLIEKDSVPFDGGMDVDMPHVVKVYPKEHPVVARKSARLANGHDFVWVWQVSGVLGVVYQVQNEA